MKVLRSALPLAALVAFAFLAAGCGDGPGGSAQARTTAADTLDAGPVLRRAAFDLEQYRGEVVLLNFWATWCGPCRAEMPDLVRLQQNLGPEGLQIIGVATDRQGEAVVEPYLERQPVNYPIVLDPGSEIGDTYGGIAALPTTLVIGRDGEVMQRLVGRLRPEPLRRRLEDVLASTAPGTTQP